MPTAGTPVHSLRTMSPKARAALLRTGIQTLEEAAALTDQELLAVPDFGEYSLTLLRVWEQDPERAAAPRETPLAGKLRTLAYAVELLERGGRALPGVPLRRAVEPYRAAKGRKP